MALTLIGVLWLIGLASVWLYPQQRLAPMHNVAQADNLSGMEHDAAVAQLEDMELEQQPVAISIEDETHETTWEEVGVRFDAEATVQRQSNIDANHRNSTSFWNFWWPRSSDVVVEMDEERFAEFFDEELAGYHDEPADAQLLIEDGEAKIREEQASWRIQSASLREELERAAANGQDTVATATHRVEPDITTADVQPLLGEAQELLNAEMTLEYPEGEYEVESDEIDAWVVVEQAEGELPEVLIDTELVAAYLRQFAEDIDTDSEPGRRIVEDGEVVEEESGEPGMELQVGDSAEALAAALEDGGDTYELAISEITPQTKVERSYSSSDEGLEALLERFATTNQGEFGMVVRTLDGEIQASYQGNRRFVPASTYKTFLIPSVYERLADGRLSRDDEIAAGSVDFCLEEMIINSTNPCALAFGRELGWAQVDRELAQAGFDGTRLDNETHERRHRYSTAAEMAELLQRLYEDDLMSEPRHNQELRQKLRRQIWRDGIPEGLPHRTVANKVGFYEEYRHDAGIITGGEQPYVLSVFSYGGQERQFAQLAREVDAAIHD